MELIELHINGTPWQEFLNRTLPEALVAHAEFWKKWVGGEGELHAQTSGSTGPPKPIVHKASSAVFSAKRTAEFFQLDEGITCLVALPAVFIAGKMMLVRAAVNKWHMEWIEPSMTPQLPERHIHFAAFTPPQALYLLENHKEKFFAIDKVILGGGVVPESLETALRHSPNEIWATYGMTETLTHVAARRISGNHFQSTYHALPGVRFTVNAEGCLQIQAPHLDEMVKTNDVVELVSETEFAWLGRADNVVNSGGLKLIPEALEMQAGDLISGSFYFGSEPDELLGERLVLYVERYAGDVHLLAQKLRERLGPARAPKEIYNLESFVRTASGKIIRVK